MASKEVRSYNSARVNVIVSGVILTGLGEDTFVNVVPTSDRVTSTAGADGEIARAINSDRRHTVTITLQQTSASNDFLSGLAMLDDVSDGSSTFPILIQDLSGRTIMAFSQSWISRLPDVGFGSAMATRDWTFETGAPTLFTIGGNS